MTTLPLPLRRSAIYWQATSPACRLLELIVASTSASTAASIAITILPASRALSIAALIAFLSTALRIIMSVLAATKFSI